MPTHCSRQSGALIDSFTTICSRAPGISPAPRRPSFRWSRTAAPARWTCSTRNRNSRSVLGSLPNVSKADEEEIARHNAEIDGPLAKLNEELTHLRRPYEERLLDTNLQELPEEIRTDTRAALETAEEERNEVQEFLFKKFQEKLHVTPEEVDKVLTEADKRAGENLEEKIKTLEGYQRSFEKVQALWDVGSPPPIRLLQRGAVESPGPRVRPGFLTVLSPPRKVGCCTSSPRQGRNQRTSAGFGPLVDEPGSSAHRPRNSQSNLVPPLRQRYRRNCRQFRPARRSPNPS